jgi:hypothetical protein
MGRDQSQESALQGKSRPRRRGSRPCGNPECQQLHRNAKYCSYSCENAAAWKRLSAEQRRAKGSQLRQRQFVIDMQRMIARCKAYGGTEDERLIIAWRYGLGASRQRRRRQVKAATGQAIAAKFCAGADGRSTNMLYMWANKGHMVRLEDGRFDVKRNGHPTCE